MCKRLLGEVSRKVDRWVRSDEVEKRVDMWREKIQPLLEEEERREAFDIHRQGDEILSVLASFSDQDQDQEQEHSLSQIVTACYQHHQEQEQQQQQGKGGENNKNKNSNNRPLVLTPRVEACRNFVAALQLACFGNVELVQDESNDDLVVRRLEDGQERPQEALLAYRAPSAMVEN
jgi:chromatin segregation and condensation protein Rec8/ScpA/Scc1 (kleisin family)